MATIVPSDEVDAAGDVPVAVIPDAVCQRRWRLKPERRAIRSANLSPGGDHKTGVVPPVEISTSEIRKLHLGDAGSRRADRKAERYGFGRVGEICDVE
ncbi:MAG: hypothetical protein R3C42_04775 [Parvularculaceae bacterium]